MKHDAFGGKGTVFFEIHVIVFVYLCQCYADLHIKFAEKSKGYKGEKEWRNIKRTLIEQLTASKNG